MTALLAAAALVSPAPLPALSPPATTAPPRAHTAAALPPDLLALAQKMEGLAPRSERFRARTAISASGAHVPRDELRFLQLFNIDISGEATSSPPSGNFKLTILGHTFTVRVIGEATYLNEPAIAKRDGGRPWIKLGRGGLGSLFGAGESTSMPAAGSNDSFKKQAGLLRHASSVRELGPGTVDGQQVTGFRMTLDESAFEEAGPAGPSKPKSITERIGLAAAAQPSRTITLEMMLASSGLPVQTRFEISSERISLGLLMDIYAVDFPLIVRAPPRRETIALAALRRLERRRQQPPHRAIEDRAVPRSKQ